MMWDFNASDNTQNPSRPSRRTPSPAFPSSPHANATVAPAFYPGNTSYMPMPNITAPPAMAYYPQQQPPVQETIPRESYQVAPPQVIIIKHSHRRHRDGRHRSHSHSHSSQPIAIPQPVTYSNSHPPSYYANDTTAHYPQPQHHSSSHHHSHGSMGDARPVVPRPQHSSPAVAAVTPTHSDDRFLCSNCTGRKKALCIGINYHGQSHELRGCINDARSVRKWLIKQHGFRNEDVVLLTDDTTERRHLPTRQNMIDAMKWLVRSAKPHDSLFFHYSGHGGQLEDRDGDEVDGFDEGSLSSDRKDKLKPAFAVIFPLDFQEAGQIVDDISHIL
ncbi:hypothetical protein D9756_010676 [Leucocoprinus leucothites]|uniref:Peptidase C14 caspase domain-containing protein n=1 Tax=Leucocoprinus leucothites TaxID=201217 RepID=A0A8H5CVS6_9AGAR|nr:hypothetical protein D9756_010676 [Leucoagaricus leucothites]